MSSCTRPSVRHSVTYLTGATVLASVINLVAGPFTKAATDRGVPAGMSGSGEWVQALRPVFRLGHRLR